MKVFIKSVEGFLRIDCWFVLTYLLEQFYTTVFKTHSLQQDVEVVRYTRFFLDRLPKLTISIGPVSGVNLFINFKGISSQLPNKLSEH